MHYLTQITQARATCAPTFTVEQRAAFIDWMTAQESGDPVEERMLAACEAGHGVPVVHSASTAAGEDEETSVSTWALPDGTWLHRWVDRAHTVNIVDWGTDRASALDQHARVCASLIDAAVWSGWSLGEHPVRITDEAVDLLTDLCALPLHDVVALLDAGATREDLVAVALVEPCDGDLSARLMLAGLTA